MANPKGTVIINCQVTPRELVIQDSTFKSSTWANVNISSTVAPNLNGRWESELLKYEDTGTVHDGYLNGARFYAEVTNATTPLATVTGVDDIEFIAFKHSGMRYSSTSALSITANTADHILIRGGAADGFVMAVLPPQGMIALPVQSPASGWTNASDEVVSGDYFFKSVNPVSLANGTSTIAMETLIFTALV